MNCIKWLSRTSPFIPSTTSINYKTFLFLTRTHTRSLAHSLVRFVGGSCFVSVWLSRMKIPCTWSISFGCLLLMRTPSFAVYVHFFFLCEKKIKTYVCIFAATLKTLRFVLMSGFVIGGTAITAFQLSYRTVGLKKKRQATPIQRWIASRVFRKLLRKTTATKTPTTMQFTRNILKSIKIFPLCDQLSFLDENT